MRKTLLVLIPWMACAGQSTPPPTKVDPVTETLHGVKITDPYRWLEDQNSPATREWLAAQDKYARSYLDAIAGRDTLRAKFEALLKIDSVGTPKLRHGRYFFSRRLAGEDRASLIVRQGYTGKDEVLVDPQTATDDATTSVRYQGISNDGSLVSIGLRHGGEDEVSVRLLDVDSRQYLPDALPRARYSGFDFKPDKSGFYYSRFTAGEGSRIYYHAMGSPSSADQEIFGKGYGPNQRIAGGLTENGRWLLIQVSEGVPAKRTELYFQDVAARGPIRNLLKEDAEFDIEETGDFLFLNTNWKAPKRRVIRIDLKNPAPEHWKEVVPESALAIEHVSAAGRRLFVSYLDNVVTHVKQFDAGGKPLGDMKLPGIGTAFGPYGRWRDDEAFFDFTSFVDPDTSYRLRVSSGQREVWFRPKVPLRSEDFETRQVWYASKDGARVPMFVVARKGLSLDGNRPVLLTGYGGFNIANTPEFSSQAAVWAEMGGVYAVANLRGGGEFGEAWHRAGMFEKKQNVFDDFLSAAEWLTQNRYTNPAQLAIVGNSNGGLLVGAALTQRPDLFRAVLCMHPLLDMLRYQKFMEAQYWVSEYGSADDPAQFKYLAAYSPYQNVKPGTKYPAVLLMSGDGDTRVDPLHARKMAARLQAATVSDQPILLRYDTQAGHSGGLPVSKQIDQLADGAEFLMWQLHLHMASANP